MSIHFECIHNLKKIIYKPCKNDRRAIGRVALHVSRLHRLHREKKIWSCGIPFWSCGIQPYPSIRTGICTQSHPPTSVTGVFR